ncbi:MAG: alpha/beta family hydrolase [Alphaproteobacteria bacterium]|nr:alpha/beta family hydrolase [Alphaproteobacteria bacterium]
MANSLLCDGPEDAPLTLALAHGAGAPMDHPFMETVARGVAAAGFRVVRFEFPYMARRRADGRKCPPDREPVLREAFAEVTDRLGRGRLVIGGKSMGGRIASMMADGLGVRGLVCLGYPFHAPGRPERVRADHLRDIKTPTLIVQGERDPFGTREEIAGYTLGRNVEVHLLPDGEHSFKPRKKSGHTEAGNLAEAVATVAAFLAKIASR